MVSFLEIYWVWYYATIVMKKNDINNKMNRPKPSKKVETNMFRRYRQ